MQSQLDQILHPVETSLAKVHLLQQRSELKIVEIVGNLRQRISFFYLFKLTEETNVNKIEMQKLIELNKVMAKRMMNMERQLKTKS